MRKVTSLFAGVALVFVAMTAIACQGNVFSLKVGDCFNGSSTGTVSDVKVVACTEAHEAEVFYVFSYPNPPSDYPGDDAMRTAAESACKPAFADFVGLDFDSSSYGLNFLRPTSDSWKTGDRSFDCLIVSGDGTALTGTAKGTKK